MTEQDRTEFYRLYDLVTSQLNGEATGQQQRELAELLRSNERAQRFYVEIMQEETSLRWWCVQDPPYEPSGHSANITTASTSWPNVRIPLRTAITATLAVSLLISLVSGFFVYRFMPESRHLAEPAPTVPADLPPNELPASPASPVLTGVATLTRMQDVSWADGVTTLAEMTRLTVGQVIRIEQGDAEIIFDKAVQLVVRGPACIEIRSPTEVFSPYGVIAARVGDSGKGFTIQTPMGRIKDLGTEFGVAIGDQGATDVAVFRGEIDLAFGAHDGGRDSASRRLVQGQALHLGADGTMSRLVAIDNTRFPSVRGGLSRALGRKSTMFTDIRDNIRDDAAAKFYRIVPGGFQEDAPAYVDRQHEWNGLDAAGLPEVLQGADYIMPFNEDKYQRTFEMTITIGRPAVLFVFLSHVSRVPDWLSTDFVDTGMKIGLDESGEFTNADFRLDAGPGAEVDTEFSVWRREIPAPTTVTLGGVRPDKKWFGFCMYGIAAVPLEGPAASKPQRSDGQESIRQLGQ